MRKNKPEFIWDEEKGISTCILKYNNNNIFVGKAYCAETDEDMKSEKTGCQIALWRAEIQYLKHLRDNEIKPSLKILKEIHSSMLQNSKFDRKCYTNRIVWRKIRSLTFDLAVVKIMLTEKRKKLKEYLNDKEKFYQRIRRNRYSESEAEEAGQE